MGVSCGTNIFDSARRRPCCRRNTLGMLWSLNDTFGIGIVMSFEVARLASVPVYKSRMLEVELDPS